MAIDFDAILANFAGRVSAEGLAAVRAALAAESATIERYAAMLVSCGGTLIAILVGQVQGLSDADREAIVAAADEIVAHISLAISAPGDF